MQNFLTSALLSVLFASATAEPVRFTEHELGSSIVDDIGDVSFKGTISVSGMLVVERDDAPYCNGACAYFIPDKSSISRLPQRITRLGETIEASPINLYEARPVLIKALGKVQTNIVLGSDLTVYRAPATITLKDFRVYGACDGIHYEATVVSGQAKTDLAKLGGEPSLGGC